MITSEPAYPPSGKGLVLGYEVVIEAIRKASTEAGEAAGAVAKIDLAAAPGSVTSALPGSRSASAAGSLGRSWTSTVEKWHTDVRGYATDLKSAADRYASNEAAAGAELHNAGG
jgi:Excreted virulence factor EspC, type VII ESX diderm